VSKAARSDDECTKTRKVKDTVTELNFLEKRKSEEYEMNRRGEEACTKVNRAERCEAKEELIADCDFRMFSFERKGFEGGGEGRQDAIEINEALEGVDEVEMQ
jgi:hypothetical protein